MRLATLILLMLINAGATNAQTTTADETSGTTATATVTTTATAAPKDEQSSGGETRRELTNLLSQSPQELSLVLAIEPSLITNEPFLAAHPELARFVAAHPEVKLQPSFYLADISGYARRGHPLERIVEPLAAVSGFAIVSFALAWLVRMIIDQKRWSRLAHTQSDVHNKILDRFGTSGELLEYVKTPAGSRFLESAPIPLHAEQPAQNPSLSRVLWSIQIGLILAAGAIGMLFVSTRYSDENGQGLFALGVIGLCIGAGFVLSAAVSIFLSRRLGILQAPAADDAGQVR